MLLPDGKNAPGAPVSWHSWKLQSRILKHPVATNELRKNHALHRLIEGVDRVGERLAAIFLADGAQIGNFDHDSAGCLVSRVRVDRSGDTEASSTGIAGTILWGSTEGELVHGGGISRRGLAACCKDATMFSVCALKVCTT